MYILKWNYQSTPIRLGERGGSRSIFPAAKSLFLESPVIFSAEKLFYVCRVCIQDQSVDNFEHDTI